MKKVFLILATAILIPVSSNCQWYTRQYDVSDIYQLSQEQLNEALKNAKGGVRFGAVVSIASVVGIIGGAILFGYRSPYSGDIGRNVAGICLLAVSISTEITGLTILLTHSSRVNNIKEVLKSKELKLGLANYQGENMFLGSKDALLPYLSLTICF